MFCIVTACSLVREYQYFGETLKMGTTCTSEILTYNTIVCHTTQKSAIWRTYRHGNCKSCEAYLLFMPVGWTKSVSVCISWSYDSERSGSLFSTIRQRVYLERRIRADIEGYGAIKYLFRINTKDLLQYQGLRSGFRLISRTVRIWELQFRDTKL